MRFKGKVWRYAVAILMGLVVTAMYVDSKDIWQERDVVRLFRVLSDGFYLPAVLFLGFGGLLWVSGTGFFTMASYGFKNLLRLFSPSGNVRQEVSYHDYRQAKIDRPPLRLRYLLVPGFLFLFAALVSTLLFFNAL